MGRREKKKTTALTDGERSQRRAVNFSHGVPLLWSVIESCKILQQIFTHSLALLPILSFIRSFIFAFIYQYIYFKCESNGRVHQSFPCKLLVFTLHTVLFHSICTRRKPRRILTAKKHCVKCSRALDGSSSWCACLPAVCI